TTLTVRRAATVTWRRPGSASTVVTETLDAAVQSRSDQVRYCWPKPDVANELGSNSPMPTGAVVQDSIVGARLYRNQRSMRKVCAFLVSHSNMSSRKGPMRSERKRPCGTARVFPSDCCTHWMPSQP